MGAIPICDKTLRDAEGQSWHFEVWSTTSDLASPEHGTVTVSIYSQEQSLDMPSHVLHVCAADWSSQWGKRFMRAFVASPEFRVRCVPVSDQPGQRHPTVHLDLPLGAAAIDVLLAPAIEALNAGGAITHVCCQGVPGETAYIALRDGRFPEKLAQCWTGAGFEVCGTTVYAIAPFGLEDEAAQHFVASLQDWLLGTLDESGSRYRVTTKRPSSLPPLPNIEEPDPELTSAIRRLIRQGSRAKFSDFARLKSGRDTWSQQKLDALRDLVKAPVIDAVGALDWPPSDLASVLRWTLRGLPVALAIRKVNTDRAIRANVGRGKVPTPRG